MSKLSYIQPNELKSEQKVVISHLNVIEGTDRFFGIIQENPLRLEMEDGSVITIPDLWADYRESDSCFIPVGDNNFPEVWTFEIVEEK